MSQSVTAASPPSARISRAGLGHARPLHGARPLCGSSGHRMALCRRTAGARGPRQALQDGESSRRHRVGGPVTPGKVGCPSRVRQAHQGAQEGAPAAAPEIPNLSGDLAKAEGARACQGRLLGLAGPRRKRLQQASPQNFPGGQPTRGGAASRRSRVGDGGCWPGARRPGRHAREAATCRGREGAVGTAAKRGPHARQGGGTP